MFRNKLLFVKKEKKEKKNRRLAFDFVFFYKDYN